MSTVPVPAARATIEDGGSSVRVSVPARRNIVAIVFILVWSAAWFFGEKQAIRQLLVVGAAEARSTLSKNTTMPVAKCRR